MTPFSDVTGPAGPSHTHVSTRGRGRRLNRVQAVAVREHTATSQQSYADVASRRALSGLSWSKDSPEAWRSEGKIWSLHSCKACQSVFAGHLISLEMQALLMLASHKRTYRQLMLIKLACGLT